jgi:N-acetylglucosaminyldiphosphoundecaprenol N-acetyl-beta-D-mannosaminyltransferase
VLTAVLVVAGVVQTWTLAPWAVAIIAVPAFVVIGLRTGRAPASAYRALLRAPIFLLRKIAVYARLTRGYEVRRWERSERPAEALGHDVRRIELPGAPIDPVTMDQAIDRIFEAIGQAPLMQVCTVNLDFMVNAQRDPEVRAIFRDSGLNIADGAPVVWLGRLLGRRIPERVAGASLIPRLIEASASRGARLFFLGGEGGVAQQAAAQLERELPGLVIAGWYEPPRTALDAMDHEEILHRVNQAEADILLVAFGHPKQDKWIARHRDRLEVSVAIGVGMCFDLIAGRVQRAPGWMQAVGLEWLYRLQQEPRRLFTRYVIDAAWLLRLTSIVVSHRWA